MPSLLLGIQSLLKLESLCWIKLHCLTKLASMIHSPTGLTQMFEVFVKRLFSLVHAEMLCLFLLCTTCFAQLCDQDFPCHRTGPPCGVRP